MTAQERRERILREECSRTFAPLAASALKSRISRSGGGVLSAIVVRFLLRRCARRCDRALPLPIAPPAMTALTLSHMIDRDGTRAARGWDGLTQAAALPREQQPGLMNSPQSAPHCGKEDSLRAPEATSYRSTPAISDSGADPEDHNMPRHTPSSSRNSLMSILPIDTLASISQRSAATQRASAGSSSPAVRSTMSRSCSSVVCAVSSAA